MTFLADMFALEVAPEPVNEKLVGVVVFVRLAFMAEYPCSVMVDCEEVTVVGPIDEIPMVPPGEEMFIGPFSVESVAPP